MVPDDQETLLWPDAVIGSEVEPGGEPVGVRVRGGSIAGVHAGRDLRAWVEARFDGGTWERLLARRGGEGEEKSEGTSPDGAARLVRVPGGILAPGFVNAHTHLELTCLEGRLSGAEGFPAWVRSILDLAGEGSEHDWVASFARGARLCLESGTTLAATVTRPGTLRALAGRLPEPSPRLLLVAEVLGFRPDLAGERLAEAVELLATFEGGVAGGDGGVVDAAPEGAAPLGFGLSPHAPYSTSPDLFRAAHREAQARGWPVTTHLGESEAELRFLREGEGPFREILEERGMWHPAWIRTADSPVAYMEAIDCLGGEGTSYVHGTHLTRNDARALARERIPLVYCPGAAEFFGVERYPLEMFLDVGVPMALGTDSLASAPTLDMLEVLRLAARRHPEVPRELLFEMATHAGARALGVERTGRIEPGCRGDLVLYLGPPGAGGAPGVSGAAASGDPWGALFGEAALGRRVFVGGRRVAGS